ncbi:FAD-dependent oxidoreductase [Halopolyspora algeriensis]|nr:FAD-dependent oxidoreductase [Halopolyspora algeriensis]
MNRVQCCVVGGGPGGMVLAYLLARAGVSVTVLETHRDFDRDFRGDSLHPATLELMDELGLAEELLELPHHKARCFRFRTSQGIFTTTDYSRLRSRFPYVALMPQSRFLDFLAQQATAIPEFRLRMGSKVIGLLGRDRVAGVRFRDETGEHELRADMVIAADGRFSRMRRLADMPVQSLGAGSDVVWFRLPHRPEDPPDADLDLYFGRGHYAAVLGQPASWQVGYTIAKGSYPQVRAAGAEPVRAFLARHVPWLADRVELLTDLNQTTLLSVDIARVSRWYRPGLLLLGDAAHVISPVGGNGILMAIQDAVASANVLVPAFRAGGPIAQDSLAEVQRVREPAIKHVQQQQVRTEQRVAPFLGSEQEFDPGVVFRMVTSIPFLRRRSARSNAYGPFPPTLDPAVLSGARQ